jgi:nucleotide-binding universal stress UspA family protein
LHRKLAGVPHEVSVCVGELWPVISDAVTKQKTDLIVIGTRGRTGVSRLFLGSVAEEIFRRACCPVLTVGPQVSQDTGRRLELKEILYATDFSQESLAALPYAVSMAQEFQSRLTLLHVVGEAKTGDLVHAEHYADSIQRQLQKLLPPETEVWCEPKCVVEHGREADKILEVATASRADLIVLGVRDAEGGMGVATHLVGSVAHEVVTRAQCPVLTVRG